MVKKKTKSRNQDEQTPCFTGFADFLNPVAKICAKSATCVQNMRHVQICDICAQYATCVQNVQNVCKMCAHMCAGCVHTCVQDMCNIL